MQNMIVIAVMIILLFFSKEKRLILSIASCCFIVELLYVLRVDNYLYFSTCAMVSACFAGYGMSIRKTESFVFSVLMLAQSALCLGLVPVPSLAISDFILCILLELNDILIFILIALGVCSSDIYNS